MAIPKKPKAPETLDDVIMSGKATQIDLASVAAPTPQADIKRVGRAKKEPSKTVGFRLPVRLIEQIQANAEAKTAGNQSAFMIRVLEGREKLEDIEPV
jgi:hypothetical protein